LNYEKAFQKKLKIIYFMVLHISMPYFFNILAQTISYIIYMAGKIFYLKTIFFTKFIQPEFIKVN